MAWQATQAKAKFSEVLDKASSEGPQVVRRRKESFLLMTRADHDALTMLRKPKKKNAGRNMSEFFRNSPLGESGIEPGRSKQTPSDGFVSAWEALGRSLGNETFEVDLARTRTKPRAAKL